MSEGKLNIREDYMIRVSDRLSEERVQKRDPLVLYVLEGTISVFMDQKRYLLHAGEFMTINPEHSFSYAMTEAGLIGLLSFSYDAVGEYFDLDHWEIDCASLRADAASEKAGSLIRGILASFMTKEDEALQASQICQLLYHIRKNMLQKKKSTILGDVKDTEAKKQQIMEYLLKNYQKKITLDDLARETYFSKSYLSRYIGRQFGRNFYALLTDVRLQHAEKDLHHPGRSITRVSMDNGFSTVNSLNRSFRERYGMTPSEYRDRLLEEEQEEQAAGEDEQLQAKVQRFLEKNRLAYARQDLNVRQVTADVSQARELHRFWSSMLNIGTARDLLRADMQSHVLRLQEELKIRYVRFWDLYAPEIMLYSGAQPGRYHFGRLDTIIDFLIEHQMHPFIELGFKPEILVSDMQNTIRNVERKSFFEADLQFASFVTQMLQHYVQRYGIEEVEQWILELWCDKDYTDPAPYLATFAALSRSIHAVSKNIRFGGPGISEENKIAPEQMIRAWKRESSRPDFFSFYGYPYNSAAGAPSDPAQEVEQSELRYVGKNYLPDNAQKYRKAMQENGFWDQPLVYSEWNFTIANRGIINDSVFKGAYVVRNLLLLIDQVDMAGYWFGSDLFTEYYDSSGLLNGSGGLLSRDGICKPALYGIQFFNRLDSYVLSSDDSCAVTTNLKDNYSIVCHNYRHPNYQYFRTGEAGIRPENLQMYFDREKQRFLFRIRGVRSGTYLVKMRTLDEEHGSVLDEWIRMGMIRNLNHADLEYLRKICVPQISISTLEAENGLLEFSCTLSPNAIASIHIYYRTDRGS